jgi:cytochrome c
MSSGLEINKALGALFLAGIIAMVAGFTAQGLYTGSIGEHAEEHAAKRGYTIEGAETATAAAGGAAAPDAGPVDIAPFMAKADVEAGKAQVKKCTSCHSFDKGGKNGVGPNQWALVGRHFASAAGYSYSEALAAKKDKVWNAQELSEFLAAPKKYLPGNKMAFAGISKPEDRANLIAYLATLK